MDKLFGEILSVKDELATQKSRMWVAINWLQSDKIDTGDTSAWPETGVPLQPLAV
jgi:hypothetical protein